MNKLTCQICGGELSSEFGVTPSVCGNCGANALLPMEKNAASGETTAPQTKSRLPTILITSFFAALFLIALFAGGAYWFVSRSYKFNRPAAKND